MNSRPEVVARAGAIDPVIVRALAAHLQAKDPAPVAASEIAELDGRRYVLLRDDGGRLLKVYRVRSAPAGRDMLKRLVRWPHDLGEGSR
jgi:hypothetical protein